MNRKLIEELLSVVEPSDQFRQVMEEASEVIQEICKLDRYGNERQADKLIEELGDLVNSIESVLYLLNVDIDKFNENRYNKMNRFINSKTSCKNSICKPKFTNESIDIPTITHELQKSVKEIDIINCQDIITTSEFVLIHPNVDYNFSKKDIKEVLVLNPINDLMLYIYKIMKKQQLEVLFLFDIEKLPRGSGYKIKLILK